MAVAAAALGMGGATAAHAADPPEVTYAASVSDDLGILQIGARSGADIKSITAHLVSYASQTEVAEIGTKDFRLFSGTRQDGTWRTKKPVKLPEFGSYRIDVEVTDADGGHVFQQSAGDFAYFVIAKFGALTVDRTAIDRDHRDVQVEGTLYGRWPTRQVKPLAARQVQIDVDYWTQTTVTTDAQGHFTASVRLDAAASVQAVFAMDGGTPTVLPGESELIQIGVDQIPTRFTSTVSATDIDLGQPVTVSVKVEQETADGWVPLAGLSGGVLFGPDDAQRDGVGRFTTADDGTFTMTYTPWRGGYFQFALDTSDDPFLQAGTGTSDVVHVHGASKFTAFTAARSDAGQVHAEGIIDFPDGGSPGRIHVHLQYSPDSVNWSTLTTVEASWGGDGNDFAADLDQSGAGYYRAVFDADNNFQSATSQTVFVPASD
ncbi:hypothetical protein [Streptomyces xylophagus]|uniref:hypothetical protein n=1 Tax=Streptomyces xylophagus TaxID=285514 RepID=UPI0005BB4693|nr:hypothetical protein [Streptomyces xylophagus]